MRKSRLLTNYFPLKKIFDFAFALIILISGLPLYLLIAILIKLDDFGPVLYSQQRVGKSGKIFKIYKYRTMRIETPTISTEDMSVFGSSYVTRTGSFLRHTSLDEVPQLINILRGEMSFVGPRPALPTQIAVLRARSLCGADQILPGITGLAQVSGRDNLTDFEKVNYDAQYFRKLSLKMDCHVILLTLWAVIIRRGAK
jgi:lipopolysaccharide/colanic/teichoic acid biosynthesis glycosyltransferase